MADDEKLRVPPFNKEDIEEIAKETIGAEFDLESNASSVTFKKAVVLEKGISGNAEVSGSITGGEIRELMSGYSFTKEPDNVNAETTSIYAGACKNGNKITFVYFVTIKVISGISQRIASFGIPTSVGNKLYPVAIGGDTNKLCYGQVWFASSYNAGTNVPYWVDKVSDNGIAIAVKTTGLTAGTYNARFELTFLLSDNLAS